MQCPHCLQNFHEHYEHKFIDQDKKGNWNVSHTICPACNQVVIFLKCMHAGSNRLLCSSLIHPKGSSRSPIPAEVQAANKELADNYQEACIVLPDSLKASAALSRRCLQILLRTAAKVKPGNLSDEIQELIDSKSLPSYLQEKH